MSLIIGNKIVPSKLVIFPSEIPAYKPAWHTGSPQQQGKRRSKKFTMSLFFFEKKLLECLVAGCQSEYCITVQHGVSRANDPGAAPPTPARETSGAVIAARVTEMNSWLRQGRSGFEQRGNTMARAGRGEPLVLVSDSGYVLYPVTKSTQSGLAANGLLMNFAEQTVRVRGTLIERGKERAIMIDSVAAYTPGTEMESLRADR